MPAAADALAAERRYLFVYAMVRLRDDDLADEAVQETLLAGLQSLDKFEGRSALRTWLVAILRNKISDLVAARRREMPVEQPEQADSEDEDGDEAFSPAGRWAESARPNAWGDPELVMRQREFWRTFERCLRALPERNAEVFVLREVLGEPVREICEALSISETNCAVMLFRARMKLRTCLEQRWFGTSAR